MRQRLLPEPAWIDEFLVDVGRVVHQQIEAPVLCVHLLEELLGLRVVGVIANHSDAVAAAADDLGDRFLERPGQGFTQ